VCASLALFWRIKKYLPFSTRNVFYNTFIFPHFSYCISLWGNSVDMSKLLKLQKRAARLILDVHNYRHSSRDLFKTLHWLPLTDVVKLRTATLVFKALNNEAPPYLKGLFKYVKDAHNVNTRSAVANDLYIPAGKKAHKVIYKYSFPIAGACIWNRLSQETRQATCSSTFKSKCFKEFLNVI
jgi:hypothetical protein